MKVVKDEKSATRKNCNPKSVQRNKWYNMKRVQHVKNATQKIRTLKKVQHENNAIWPKCNKKQRNKKKVQHEKNTMQRK